jgi:hypothetical protein
MVDQAPRSFAWRARFSTCGFFLKHLVGIDINCDRDVFRERQFAERFADEAAETHDRYALGSKCENGIALKLCRAAPVRPRASKQMLFQINRNSCQFEEAGD